tara:strand:- start:350 stop:1468 length:1119 start_codon:yes stop_codon:yes gene_type:complete
MNKFNFQKRKKNLLLISSSGQIGGGPRHMLLLIKQLHSLFDIYIACPLNSPFSELLKDFDGIKIIGIKERKINFMDLVRLRLCVKNYSIDIIHSHGKGAGVIGRTLSLVSKVPLIHTFHGIHIRCNTLISKTIYILYENLTGWIDTYKIFVSKGELEEAKSNHIINNSSKHSIIYNAVNDVIIDENNNQKIRIKYNLNPNIKIVTSLCRLEAQKNIFEIIAISKLCRENVFLILGTGSLKRDLERKINHEKIQNIIMPGNVNNPIDYLRESDIFLSTSLYEGHPISVLEAMSVALPIVASNVTGNSETIIHGESGYLYKPGKIIYAANHILRLSENPNIRKSLGENAKNRQQELFSVSRMTNDYIKIYSEIS